MATVDAETQPVSLVRLQQRGALEADIDRVRTRIEPGTVTCVRPRTPA